MGGLGGSALVHLIPPAGFPLNPGGGRWLKGGGGLGCGRVDVVLKEEEEEEVEQEEASVVSLRKTHQKIGKLLCHPSCHAHSLVLTLSSVS